MPASGAALLNGGVSSKKNRSHSPLRSPQPVMSAIDGSAVSLADLQLAHMLNGKLGLFIVQFDAKRVTRRGFLLAGAFCLYLYDTIITFPLEIKYVWKAKINIDKVCYLALFKIGRLTCFARRSI